MTADDLEFSLSQYADGTLPDAERPAIEARLAADPAARAILAEYRELGQLLREPPIDLDWDRLASHLSSAVHAGQRHAGPSDGDVVAGRIGWAWGNRAWRIGALAAAAVVAVTVARLAQHARNPALPTPQPTPHLVRVVGPTVAVVSGPAVEAGAGPAVDQVSIGPSPALLARGGSGRYGEGVVSRPATIVIAGAQGLGGDDVRFR